MSYKQHEFVDVRKLTLQTKRDIINDAFEMNFKWWVDILDCSKSWRRQKIEMSFNDIMKKFNDKSHFTVVRRYRPIEPTEYGEIGFCTMDVNNPDYFLWI